MIKKISFVLLLIAAIACGTWGYLYLTDLKRPKINPLSMLPDTCFAVIEANDLHALTQKLNQGNLMWEEFIKADELGKFNNLLLHIDSLYLNPVSEKPFEVQNIYVAFYQNKNTIPLAAFNLKDINTNDYFISFLENRFSAKKTETNVFECAYKKQVFYVYVNAGLILLCEENAFLQNIIKETPQSLQQNTRFANLYQTKDKESDLNIFVHLPYLYHNGWNLFFHTEVKNKNQYGAQNEAWMLADLNFNPNEINAQGFLSNDSSAFYNTLKNQENISYKDAYENIPYNVSELQILSIKNYETFIKNACGKSEEERNRVLKYYAERLNANIEIEVEKFIGDYAALFNVFANEEEYSLGLVNFQDEKLAVEFLQGVADSSFLNSDSSRVYLDNGNDLFLLLGGGGYAQHFKYVTCLESAFLFGNDLPILSESKRNILQKNTLVNNERVMKFIEKKVSDESAYLFYADVFKSKEKIQNSLSDKVNKIIAQNPEMLTKYEHVALTMEKLKGNLFFKACTNFNPKNKIYQNTLWETLLDTNLYLLPSPVKNHNTNETELVCQDVNNNLYLLSSTGRILWKKDIGEKILGEIYQVDFFNNNKLQLLFNTASKLFLVDRNGNEVSGYPVNLVQPALGGLTLLDYEKNKNYRLWLPQINGTTVCYAINGKQLPDFIPVKNVGKPIHLVLQQKDYFILIDSIGNINVCNRKGENRVLIKNKITNNVNSLYIEEGKNPETTHICYINRAENKLTKISLTDKQQEMPIFINEPVLQAFIDTLQNPTNPQLVCLTENKLEVFDFFGKKIYNLKLEFKISGTISPLFIKDKRMYAAIEENTNKLFLLDAQNNKVMDTEMKLSALPISCRLITNQKPYLIGFYGNKVFCVKQ